MTEATRTVRIVTSDEALLSSARGAVAALKGWGIGEPQTVEDLLAGPLHSGDAVLLDAWLRTENVYESCRRLTGRTRCPIYVVTDERNSLGAEIAAFCGATGTIERPLSGEVLRGILEGKSKKGRALPEEARQEEGSEREAPENLLRAIVGEGAPRLVDALIDPETGLYSYDYLNFKLDEEYKRSERFDLPLSCVMLGHEGQVEDDVLGALAGIFLNASRDTDLLGRFDQNSFLFFLPNTGPDGARIMATRIRESAESKGLRDLVGDPLIIAVGISFAPHPEIEKREDLFSRARAAFMAAQQKGEIVVACD